MAGRITAIKMQKRNKNRANIFLDGQFAFGLALIKAASLSKEQYLSDEDIDALQQSDQEEQAYEKALIFLSYRPRSSAEVAQRLRRKKIQENAIQAVLLRLERAKLIDNEAFARYWIQNREQFNPRGRYALRQELQQKGIDSRIIDPLLDELDEPKSAYRVAKKRFARWEKLDETTRRRKLSDYLLRRGFSYEVVRDTWERITTEIEMEGT